MAPLTTNKAKEDAAIAWVMELERANGRQPQDTRYVGAPADIESPPRLIEVAVRNHHARLRPADGGSADRGGPAQPELLRVRSENIGQGDPAEFTLRVLGGPRLQRLLERAKEFRGYYVPWPVADYDAGPLGLDG